ncbi:hypothetical protein EON66_00455 [archaeon]|nr:MAG: hypothetical protein EON66_00455 [archaeon]
MDVDAWEDKLLSAGARQEALPAASQAESSEQQVGGAAWDGAAEAGGYAPEPFELTQTEDEVLIAQMDSRKQMGARVLGAHARYVQLARKRLDARLAVLHAWLPHAHACGAVRAGVRLQ